MTQARDLGNVGDTLAGVSNVNIDSGTLFVDTTNNLVGIRTTTPGYTLEVRNDSNTVTNWIAVTNRGTTGLFGAGYLLIANNTNYSGLGQSGLGQFALFNALSTGNVVISSGTTGNMFFQRNQSITDMQINSSGHVTMPNKPLFRGVPTNDYASAGMPTGVIPFTAGINNGNHYSAATSRFTCPTAGYYRVTWGGLQLASTVTSLMINGVRTFNGNHYATATTGTPNYIAMTQTAIVSAAASDYFQIEGWNGGGYYSTWYLWTVELIA